MPLTSKHRSQKRDHDICWWKSMFIFTFIFYQFYQLETLWKDKQLLRSGRKLPVTWQYLPTLYTYLPFTLRSGRKLPVTWQYLPTLYTYLPFTLRSGRKLPVTWQYLPTLYTYLPFTLRSGRKLPVTWQYLPTLYTYLPFTCVNQNICLSAFLSTSFYLVNNMVEILLTWHLPTIQRQSHGR
jgi:hypothetical protein